MHERDQEIYAIIGPAMEMRCVPVNGRLERVCQGVLAIGLA